MQCKTGFSIKSNVYQMLAGHWLVGVAELGYVDVHEFKSEEEARTFFSSNASSKYRILQDSNGVEVMLGGPEAASASEVPSPGPPVNASNKAFDMIRQRLREWRAAAAEAGNKGQSTEEAGKEQKSIQDDTPATNNDNSSSKKRRGFFGRFAKFAGAAGGATAGAAVANAAAVGVVQGIGFTAAGIAGNSVAAGMMSAEAIASGGAIVSGGVVSTLQAIGASGSLASAPAVVAIAVPLVGAAMGAFAVIKASQAIGRGLARRCTAGDDQEAESAGNHNPQDNKCTQ